jgi:hypothetical protein
MHKIIKALYTPEQFEKKWIFEGKFIQKIWSLVNIYDEKDNPKFLVQNCFFDS